MAESIENLKVAILATEGVEQSELTSPRDALKAAGARVELVSPKRDVRAWQHDKWGETLSADRLLDDVDADEYDALVLPGGAMNPDKLRMETAAVDFVRAFFDAGKPIAAICHGPWLLVEADIVRGRRVTSWPSIRTDLKNAGAEWEDSEVVRDANLVTSRKPDDLPAFNREMLALFAQKPMTDVNAKSPYQETLARH